LQDGPRQQVGVGPAGPQRVANLRIDLRDHLEQRGRVIPQAHLDLVGDLQAGQPDQRGLPQRQHLASQLAFDAAAVVGLGVPLGVQPHQLGDPVLRDEDGAPAGLGGMGGDHRRHQRTLQRLGNRGRIQLRRIEFRVCCGQAAVLRRLTRGDVDCAAALPVDVFGHVGQQREVTERPDDRDRPADVDAVEHLRHVGPLDLRAAHPERLHAGAFHEVEHLVAVLLADGVAEDGTQHPDVGAHGLGRLAADLGPPHGADRLQRGVGSLSHAYQYLGGSRAPPVERSAGGGRT
jgi:hypothetical protein